MPCTFSSHSLVVLVSTDSEYLGPVRAASRVLQWLVISERPEASAADGGVGGSVGGGGGGGGGRESYSIPTMRVSRLGNAATTRKELQIVDSLFSREREKRWPRLENFVAFAVFYDDKDSGKSVWI